VDTRPHLQLVDSSTSKIHQGNRSKAHGIEDYNSELWKYINQRGKGHRRLLRPDSAQSHLIHRCRTTGMHRRVCYAANRTIFDVCGPLILYDAPISPSLSISFVRAVRLLDARPRCICNHLFIDIPNVLLDWYSFATRPTRVLARFRQLSTFATSRCSTVGTRLALQAKTTYAVTSGKPTTLTHLKTDVDSG
jgi:hypothetical protein